MAEHHLRENLRSIRNGKMFADFMIVSAHVHQNSYSFQQYSFDKHVTDFLVELAHAAIDNGADMFVGHGVHTIRGIEIYSEILEKLQRLSRPFATEMTIENGTAVIARNSPAR